MAVVIRMMRAGAKKRPFYRVVVADSRRQRDGRFIEILGYYDPIANPFALKLNKDAVTQWIAKGAQPSEQAASLLRMQGIAFMSASKSAKKPAEGAVKKAAKKRASPRKPTERRTIAKAARAKKRAKIAARAVAPKEKKKKK